MNEALNLYKNFIDRIVKLKECIPSIWVTGNGYPQTKDNEKINHMLKTLNKEQKELIAIMLQDAKISGIHDTLACINEMMDCDKLVISQNGYVYPYDYFDSMHYDFICRSSGDEWPE